MSESLDLAWQARHWVQLEKPGPHTLLSAMADEIERLRGDLEVMRLQRDAARRGEATTCAE